jgi:uncharacterized membrane protein YedE/YeeE
MALSVAQRVPLDRIEDRARRARPGRAVLTVIAAVLFGLGWLAFRACALSWLAVAWCGSAVIEGWQSAKAARQAT